MEDSPSQSAECVQIDAVRSQDLDDLKSFMAAWPGEEHSANRWHARLHQWWDANPYFQPEGIRGYALKADDRIVGFFGLIPMAFQLAGQELLVFASSTWRVLPEYRRFSLKLASLIRQAGCNTLLFTWSASETVGQAHIRFGYSRISRSGAFSQSVPSTILIRLLNAQSNSLRVVSPLVNAHSLLAWARMSVAARHLESHRLQNATEEVDHFWNATKGQVPNTHVRDSRFLNWYCFSDKVFHKRLYGCYRRGRLCGLLMVGEKTPKGLRILECLDLWTDLDSQGVFDSLFSALLRDVWRDGINGIELPPFTREIVSFAKARWFLPRRVRRYPEFVFGPRHLVDTLLSGSTALYGAVGDYYL